MSTILVYCFNSIVVVLLYSIAVFYEDSLLMVRGSEVVHRGANKEVRIGQVLNLKSHVGDMGDVCIDLAVRDFYVGHPSYQTKIALVKRHSDDEVTAASAVLDLLEVEKVVAIIGPQSSKEATFAMELGRQAQVPMIAFSVTSPSLSNEKNPYFVRAAQNDSYQVQALTAIVKGFGWEEVILIYEESVYGNAIIPYLTDAFQDANIRITYKVSFQKTANNSEIGSEVKRMTKIPTRVFLVHMMTTSLASRIFEHANNTSLMSKGYAWLITDGLSNSLDDLEPIVNDYMEGVIGVKPYVPRSPKLQGFTDKWKKYFPYMKPNSSVLEVNVFGLWAYDMVWALAEAVEKIGPINAEFIKSNDTKRGEITDLTNLGISQIGPVLLKEISNMKLKNALSGDFHLVNGQLEPLSLEIFNVVGNGQRIIGYWNPTTGISKTPTPSYPKDKPPPYSTSMENLKHIIWPGDSVVKPAGKGPPPSRRMRIAVIEKKGFPGFVKLEGRSKYTGYSIDVFQAVVSSLPNLTKFEYEFVSPPTHQDSTFDFEELMYQVDNQTVDAVVGDTYMLRSRWSMDLSLPYSELGVSMVMPIHIARTKDMWIFVHPFSKPLWTVVIGAYFIILIVVFFLESPREEVKESGQHQEHQEQGQQHPVESTLKLNELLSWSTIAVIHHFLTKRELGYRSMFILVVWQWLLLIIVPIYIAHLSIVIAETSQDLKVDIKRDDFYIGYQNGSFVKDLLIQELNKQENQLKAYTTMEQYHAAMSEGSKKGGVSAIVDENPYIQLFLAQHCTKYIVDGPSLKGVGLSFAFRRGSPLVVEISKAILNISRSGKLKEIEQKYFNPNSPCESTKDHPLPLALADLKGLFLFAACLIIVIIVAARCEKNITVAIKDGFKAFIRGLANKIKNWWRPEKEPLLA